MGEETNFPLQNSLVFCTSAQAAPANSQAGMQSADLSPYYPVQYAVERLLSYTHKHTDFESKPSSMDVLTNHLAHGYIFGMKKFPHALG